VPATLVRPNAPQELEINLLVAGCGVHPPRTQPASKLVANPLQRLLVAQPCLDFAYTAPAITAAVDRQRVLHLIE
jgi:hypothetical protein